VPVRTIDVGSQLRNRICGQAEGTKVNKKGKTSVLIPAVTILGFLCSPRLKETGRGRNLCRLDLVDMFKQNVPARRQAPTNAQAAIGHYFRHML